MGDVEENGYIRFDAFCLMLEQTEAPELHRAFKNFDNDCLGELDLRQFIVGISMYTDASVEDKFKLAFMMFDENQTGELDRATLLKMLLAIAPLVPMSMSERHVGRIYSQYSLHPQASVGLEWFLHYACSSHKDLIPSMLQSRMPTRTHSRTLSKVSRNASHQTDASSAATPSYLDSR